jgi:hypothetical protein
MGPSAVYVSNPTPFKPKIDGMTIGSDGLFSEIRLLPSNA